MADRKKVLMICTGGTIGMLHQIEDDSNSPLVPAEWAALEKHSPALKELDFEVDTHEMELIDSSDMNPVYWVKLAKEIRDKYNEYSGFVVLHGTDTMTYTATALSFLFENLGKPVIVTGSQLPLAKPRSDAAQNLVTALMFAAADGGIPVIPEVCILFNNVLLRGNRSRKISSTGFTGFDTPNSEILAEIGEHIRVNTNIVRKVPSEDFYINEYLMPNVMLFDIFPGISAEILRNVFSIKDLKGVVMRTYGAGNAPTDTDFIREIEDAIRKGITVVNITQCTQGMVEMGLYDASAGLLRIGVISGVDLTSEAALVKMMFLLGQGYEGETFKDQMQRSLRGEQSVNVFNFTFERDKTSDKVRNLVTKPIPGGITKEKITKANVRFDMRGTDKESKALKLAVFMNYPNADANASTEIPQCLGVIENRDNCMFECTRKVSRLIDPTRPLQLKVVSYGEDVSWEGMVFSIYTDVD